MSVRAFAEAIDDSLSDSDRYTHAINYASSLIRAPKEKKCIIIRVFTGSVEGGHQFGPFIAAFNQLGFSRDQRIRLETINVQEIKDLRWRARDLIDWFLESHIHFILSHIHQGLQPAHWDMEDLLVELNRLYFHTGFPSGKQLQCPIFTQNKAEYLKAVPHICNPSLFVLCNEENVFTDEVTTGILER